jgi:hypothetical protein
MAKIQGILPIYDPETKRILGAFLLPYAKTFNGDETTHNIDFPSTTDPTNTVPVQKIEPDYQPVNSSRKAVDWFMAAVFTDAEIRSGYYKQFKNFSPIEDMAPSSEWVGAASHSQGQFRVNWGALVTGLESGFDTGAQNELAPRNTIAPTLGATAANADVTVGLGTWVGDGGSTIIYAWFLDGVLQGDTDNTFHTPVGSTGAKLRCRVTKTLAGYAGSALSNEITIS